MELRAQQRVQLFLNSTVLLLTLKHEKEKGQVQDLPLQSNREKILNYEMKHP